MAGTEYRTLADFEVRPVQPADAEAIGGLAHALWPEGVADITMERGRHLIADLHQSSAVAVRDGAIVGATLTRQLGPVVFLAWAIVAEPEQGRG